MVLHKSPKDLEMSSDAAIARSIIAEAFGLERGGRNRSRVIAAAYETLKMVERRLPKETLTARSRTWAERRVRTIVDQEATRVDHYEILDLKAAAHEEARRELNRSRQRAKAMAAYLAASSEDIRGDEIERMGAIARGVGLSGVVRSGTGSRDDDPTEFSD